MGSRGVPFISGLGRYNKKPHRRSFAGTGYESPRKILDPGKNRLAGVQCSFAGRGTLLACWVPRAL